MNKQIKQQWIDALLSGKYKQTKGVLRDEHGFCCLGVLCDIVDKEAWTWNDNLPAWTYKYESGVLPGEVLRFVDIIGYGETVQIKVDDEDADKYGLGEEPALSELNDNGVSFEDIAKIIEKYL